MRDQQDCTKALEIREQYETTTIMEIFEPSFSSTASAEEGPGSVFLDEND